MVNDVKVLFGKGPGSQPVSKDANGHAPMWKKKSIFWELPYRRDAPDEESLCEPARLHGRV